MAEDKQKQKCNRCNNNLTIDKFKLKKDDTRQRVCMECIIKCREYRQGDGRCQHDREISKCKECGGSEICPHDRIRSTCKECGGGSICPHDRIRSTCKECGGGSICPHDRLRSKCKECDPIGHLAHIVRTQVRKALKGEKELSSSEYVGCTTKEFRKHIEDQFKEGMSWDNYGEWHIDHIVPIKYEDPTIEEVAERLNYLNTQPLWAEDNLAKGNRYCS